MAEQNQVIVVEQLIEGTTLIEVEQYFQREGEVVEALLWKTGAVVLYKTNAIATRAVSKLNGRSFKGNKIDVHLNLCNIINCL